MDFVVAPRGGCSSIETRSIWNLDFFVVVEGKLENLEETLRVG